MTPNARSRNGWATTLLIAAALVLLVPLGVAAIGARWFAERLIVQETENSLLGARQVFDQLVEMETRLLQVVAGSVQSDASLQAAFLRRDREELYRLALPYLERAGELMDGVHIAFLTADKQVFLRVHEPTRHGDTPQMPTQGAAHPGKGAQGIEITPLGEMVVRVMQPWRLGGRHVGYIATARKLSDVSGQLKESVRADVLLLVDKSVIARPVWETAAQRTGMLPGWDTFADHVVVSQTIKALPPTLARRIDAVHHGGRPVLTSDRLGRVQYGIGIFPLQDTSGLPMGEMAILFDRTATAREVSRLLLLPTLAAMASGALLFGLFCRHVRRLDRRLEQSHARLESEIDDHARAEEELVKANAFLSTVIESLPYPFSVIDAATYRVVMSNTLARGALVEGRQRCHEISHGSPVPCGENRHPCPLAAVRRDGRPVVVEHVHAVPDGGDKHFEVHGYPIADSGGKLIQMIEYCIDISRRRQLEEEKERVIAELKETLAMVRTLQGLLPICAGCKKIRVEGGDPKVQAAWEPIERYIHDRTDVQFTHGLCPECVREYFGPPGEP